MPHAIAKRVPARGCESGHSWLHPVLDLLQIGYAVYGSTITGNVLFYMPDDISKRFSTALLFLHVCVSYVMAQQVVGRAIHVRVDAFSVDKNNSREKGKVLASQCASWLLCWNYTRVFFSSFQLFFNALILSIFFC